MHDQGRQAVQTREEIDDLLESRELGDHVEPYSCATVIS